MMGVFVSELFGSFDINFKIWQGVLLIYTGKIKDIIEPHSVIYCKKDIVKSHDRRGHA